MAEKAPLKAAILVIGNEILSGRTQDKNIQHIALKLGEKGISVIEIRVVPDIEAEIVKAVNELKGKVDYLFTTGGIGPTHDDITADSVAKAFGVKNLLNAEARSILAGNYGDENLNEGRLKMAKVPEGAQLIRNPVSGAPGFILGNVYVMAGVPAIMQGMLDNVLPNLKGGAKVFANSVSCQLPESVIAIELGELQKRYAHIDIGSYPNFKQGVASLSLVLRGTDTNAIKNATKELIEIITKLGSHHLTDLQVPI
jgi:molybdenum cofactor synthesis domain-containing protein